MNLIFHIYAPLVVQYMCLLHHQKERKWVPNTVWAFMLGLIHRPSLGSWNRLLVIFLLPDSQIVISMKLCFHRLGHLKLKCLRSKKPVKVFYWNEKNLSQFDPRTPECENEVQRIIHLQAIANRLPDAFNDATKVMKSHIPVVNAPARIAVPEGQAKMDENPPQLKRGRPIGSKDTVPRKRRGRNQESTPEEPGVVLASKELNALEEAQTHEKITNPRNTENSIIYCNEIWDRNKIIIDDIFAFSVAHKIMDDDCEPQSIIECRQRQD